MKAGDSHIKYAKALLNLALRLGIEERVLNELSELSALYADERFAGLIRQFTFMDWEKGRKVLDDLFGKQLEKCLFNLLIILFQNRKLALLPRVNQIFRKLYHRQKGIADITLVTARELSAEEMDSLNKLLSSKKNKKISVNYKINNDLVGGVQYYEEGYLTDLSVSNYLQVIKKHLISSNTH